MTAKPLPSVAISDTCGFTCTGLYFNPIDSMFYVGNIGKLRPDVCEFKSTIEVIDKSFNEIARTINLYEFLPNMCDIQGLCVDSTDSTLWVCSCLENKVWNITQDGDVIRSIVFENPSGIAENTKNNTLYILGAKSLNEITKDGNQIRKMEISLPGQDQLYYDVGRDELLMTYGNKYDRSNGLCVISLSNWKIARRMKLHDSYAVEGIAMMDSFIYVVNDGMYHSAKNPLNIVLTYNYNDIK